MSQTGTSSSRSRLLTILLRSCQLSAISYQPNPLRRRLPRQSVARFRSRCVVLYRQTRPRGLGLFLRLPGWQVEASLVFSLSWWRHGMGCWTHDVVSGRHYLRLGSLHLTWRSMP